MSAYNMFALRNKKKNINIFLLKRVPYPGYCSLLKFTTSMTSFYIYGKVK